MSRHLTSDSLCRSSRGHISDWSRFPLAPRYKSLIYLWFQFISFRIWVYLQKRTGNGIDYSAGWTDSCRGTYNSYFHQSYYFWAQLFRFSQLLILHPCLIFILHALTIKILKVYCCKTAKHKIISLTICEETYQASAHMTVQPPRQCLLWQRTSAKSVLQL